MLRRIKSSVLKLLRHLLCVGLLFGLAGNGIAVAAPCIFMEQGQAAAIADMLDCQMASTCPNCSEKGDTGHKPSKDKAPGCLAMAACAAVIAMKEPDPAAAVLHQTTTVRFWPTAAILAGRDVAPEPEPPALLG